MPKILIVEDEPHMVKIVQDRLAAKGYEIAVARDGEEALAQVKLERPDLILLDILMPKLDGFEVCKRLKADEKTRRIPVMILTAKTGLADENCGLELGVDAYIMKPFDLSLLEWAIASAFAQKRKG
jgi:DNA-binding response OmpR family regulator